MKSRNESQIDDIKRKLDAQLQPYHYGLTRVELQEMFQHDDNVPDNLLERALSGYPTVSARPMGEKYDRFTPHGIYVPADSPSQSQITYLANRKRKIKGPQDKPNNGSNYFSAYNYRVECNTFRDAFDNVSLNGFQFVPGGFYHVWDEDKEVLAIRRNGQLAYAQVFLVEFDKDLGYACLEDVVQKNQFIAENAALLATSVSGFPKFRVFFMYPMPVVDYDDKMQIDYVCKQLLAEFDGTADANGTNPTNGAFGCVGQEFIWIDKWIQHETIARWHAQAQVQTKSTIRTPIEWDSEITEIPQEYRDVLETSKKNKHGWTVTRVPCPHVNHSHDGWGNAENGCELRKAEGGMYTKCWKCKGEDISKPKIRFIGRKAQTASQRSEIQESIRMEREAYADFLRRMKDGSIEIPPPVQMPTPQERQRGQGIRVSRRELSPLAMRRTKDITKKAESPDTIPLGTSDSQIKIAYLKQSRIIGLNAPTGAGKDETHMHVVINNHLHSLESKPHHRLAREKAGRWGELTVSTAHWTGILHGVEIVEAMTWEERLRDPFPEDGSWKCIQPRKAWAYMQRGGNRHVGICQTCPANEACYAIGFNAQAMHAKSKRAIVTAIDDLFTNPIYESFSEKLYIVAPKDEEPETEKGIRLAVMDEVDVKGLFIDCQLDIEQLRVWEDMWQGTELAEWAKNVREILTQQQSFDALESHIMGIDDELTQKLSEQMSKVRTPYTARRFETVDAETEEVLSSFKITFPNGMEACLAKDYRAYQILINKDVPTVLAQEIAEEGVLELTLDSAFQVGIYGKPADMEVDDIETKLPRVYPDYWNPLRQLKLLFERYSAPSAPIKLRGNVLRWSVPPQLHDHIQRIVFTSATLDEELFLRAMSEYANSIEFVQVKPTPLTGASRIFRLRTGKYCRGTILHDDKSKFGFKPAGERLWQMFVAEVLANPAKTHALITYKCIIKHHREWIDAQKNVIADANFGGLTGIDSMQDADYLWIIGDPEIPHPDIEFAAKQLYGDDEKPLSFERDEQNQNNYIDPRVLRVWQNAVQGELKQAVGRARLNRTEGTVILLTGIDIPDVTNRPECIRFDYQDWLAALESVENLAREVAHREEEEERLHELAQTDMTAIEISKQFKELPANTIRNYRRTHGFAHASKQGRKKRLTPEIESQIVEFVKKRRAELKKKRGEVGDASKQFGFNRHLIASVLETHGLR